MILPASMKRMRSASSFAKFISWVTMSRVIPVCAKLRMTARTSFTISGSNADVGSSKRIASGFMASVRAIATRCF